MAITKKKPGSERRDALAHELDEFSAKGIVELDNDKTAKHDVGPPRAPVLQSRGISIVVVACPRYR